MCADLEAKKAKTAFLKDQITKIKKAINKAKDIVEKSKHIKLLDSNNKILKQERKDMLKMHEDSMKVLQESANTDMNRLKEEIAMLKEQKKAADEQNQRNLEAYKILRQEWDSMADTLQQAEIRIFTPIGLTQSPPPPRMHGPCRQLHQHRHQACQGGSQASPDQHQISGFHDEVLGDLAPSLRAYCKLESFMYLAGARMALSMVKAHYEDADIDTVTSGIPDVDDDGQKIDHKAILVLLAGYDTRVSELVDPNVFVSMETIDDNSQSSSESLKTTDFEEDGSPASDDAASKSPPREE